MKMTTVTTRLRKLSELLGQRQLSTMTVLMMRDQSEEMRRFGEPSGMILII